MSKVTLRQAAIDDLNAIWEYTCEEWSEEQADRYYAQLKDTCNQIGKYPELQKSYKEIEKDLFGVKSGKHIMFFKILNNQEVEVIRILHARMDLKNRISEI